MHRQICGVSTVDLYTHIYGLVSYCITIFAFILSVGHYMYLIVS